MGLLRHPIDESSHCECYSAKRNQVGHTGVLIPKWI